MMVMMEGMKLKLEPCTMGSPEPSLGEVWIRVATPMPKYTQEMNAPICRVSMPMAGPKMRGTRVVAPKRVSTCCAPARIMMGVGGLSLSP